MAPTRRWRWHIEYIICYDIADDGRRSRIASALLDFGARIEESVFLAHLDEALAAKMRMRMEKLIDREHDRMHIFALCAACAGKTIVLGTAELVEDREFYII